MEVGILGALEVIDAGRPIPVRRPRERALLTMLAFETGRSVPKDRLIDGLWGEEPPATAAKTLQTYIHHLRGILPEGVIVTEPPGYRLAVDETAVDVHRFRALIHDATAVVESQPASAVSILREALSLWRGAAAADAIDAGWLRPQLARLEDERTRATVQVLELEVEAGRHEAVLADIRAAVEEWPLREDLWALYMLSLYRSGRQAEALRAFADARRRLGEELGIEPGPQLRDLEDRILSQEPSLLPDSAPMLEPAAKTPDSVADATEPHQRLVTVVRAYLDRLSSLRETVGDGKGRRVADELRGAMSRIVEGFGGSLLEIREDSILAAFGLPVAREDDTYRAIRTGLQLIRAVEQEAAEVERSWAVDGPTCRVVVFTLPMQVASSDVGGGLSVEAVEPPVGPGGAGSVVVDEHTRQLMEGLFEWVPTSSGAWQVRKVKSGSDKARVGRRLHAPLTGRDGELEEGLEALAGLERGLGGMTVLSGEAGVGKTRLLDELRRRKGEDVTWLAGNCAAHGEATPYWPFRELIRDWVGVGIDDTDLQARLALHDALERVAPDQADEFYPYLGGVLGITLEPEQAHRLQLAPEALQYRTFEVVGSLLEVMAGEKPAVVALEDLHWADVTSLRLLERLLPLTETCALLLVLTTRPEPDHPSSELIEEARRRLPHRVRQISLPLLDDEAQRRMLAALIDDTVLPGPIQERILTLAEGNPFYLEELIGSLIDRGALENVGGRWLVREVELVVPETVEKVVQARIDTLGDTARDLITAAAVLGRSFGLPLLQGVVSQEGAPLDAIYELLRMDLLVEVRRWPQAEFHFRHALIQEAVERTIPTGRRRDLHRRAAEWLERRHEHNLDELMGRLAVHWESAGDDAKAVEMLIRAGDLARRDNALDEAIDHYRKLLPILERLGDTRTMALVMFKLALALHNALRFAEANRVYQRAFPLWSPESGPEPSVHLAFATPPFYQVPDPVRSYSLPDMQLQMALFDRLVERWPEDTLVPSLAEWWEISDDGLTYRFRLRDGLTWSDGHPLTAHDAVYGILRNLDRERPGVGLAMFYVLEGALEHIHGEEAAIGVEALDDRIVEFRLVNPAPYFLAMLNRPDCGPQPRHAIEAHREAWVEVSREVVSGAFRRQSHTPARTVLVRRRDYQGHRIGNVEGVTWTHGTPAEIADRYVAGSADLVWVPSASIENGLERIPSDHVHLGPRSGLTYLAFVFGQAEPVPLAVRRALAYAVDRERLAPSLPASATPATGGVVPPALAGHTPDTVPGFDPERARDLAAGFSGLSPLRIPCPVREGLVMGDLMRAIVEGWTANLPLDLEPVGVDWAAYLDSLDDPSDWDLVVATWYPGYTDPEYFLRLLLHSEASSNYGRYASAEYDELIRRACSATDESTRLELFHRADRLVVAEDVAVIPLSYDSTASFHSTDVEGWWEFGKSWSNFADLVVHAGS